MGLSKLQRIGSLGINHIPCSACQSAEKSWCMESAQFIQVCEEVVSVSHILLLVYITSMINFITRIMCGVVCFLSCVVWITSITLALLFCALLQCLFSTFRVNLMHFSIPANQSICGTGILPCNFLKSLECGLVGFWYKWWFIMSMR